MVPDVFAMEGKAKWCSPRMVSGYYITTIQVSDNS